MQVLRSAIPAVDGKKDLVEYFDATYVTGAARRIKRPQTSSTASTSDSGTNQLATRLRRISAPFPLQECNVHDATLQDNARTN